MKEKTSLATISSLTSIISFIASLTIANSITVLLTGGEQNRVLNYSELCVHSVLLCVFMIICVIRFYHGKIKHMQMEYYNFAYNISDGKRVTSDFFIIFFQSIILAVMSFYINDISSFVVLFGFLLIVDIIWSIIWSIVRKRLRDQYESINSYGKWLIINMISMVILIICAMQSLTIIKYIILYMVLFGNAIADYAFNRKYYFDVRKRPTRINEIFVAAAYTNKLDPATGELPVEYKNFMNELNTHLRTYSTNLTSFYIFVSDANNKAKEIDAFRINFQNIAKADFVVAYVENNIVSEGVLIELGFAVQLRKNIIVLIDEQKDSNTPKYIDGLSKWTSIEIIKYKNISNMKDQLTLKLSTYDESRP